MTSAPVEPSRWRAGRWGGAIAIVLALQCVLLFWLGRQAPAPARPVASTPAFRLNNNASGLWLALQDPTLFALPHVEGFSGAAWLCVTQLNFEVKDWTEPPRWLDLSVSQLGDEFKRFVGGRAAPLFPRLALPEPEWSVPEIAPAVPIAIPSTLRIEGDLAKRQLLSEFQLPSWASTDLLTNSVVQLLVDARGNVFSAVLLSFFNGPRDKVQSEADLYALDRAKTARFDPLPAPASTSIGDASGRLTIGTLVFEWQTVPKPATNAPPSAP